MKYSEVLTKRARIKTQLQPHQVKALQKALANNLILAHSTGSGKTLTSIAIADALGKPTTVLTPASLVSNYLKELRKHKSGGPDVQVMSLPTAVKQNYTIPEGNTVILDEAHSLRNAGTAKQQYVKQQLANAGRIIALTGTPGYNSVEDFAPLLNIVSRSSLIPENSKDFRKKYIREEKTYPGLYARLVKGVKSGSTEYLKNEAELRALASKYMDVFETDVEKPQRIDEVIEVPMDKAQEAVYRYVVKSMPVSMRYKVYNNIPPTKQEAAQLNAFLNAARQVSNTPEAYQVSGTPGAKILAAVAKLEEQRKADPNFRALVYSNYLDSGINSYARQLDAKGIPYSTFTGSLTAKQKQDIVDKYNRGEVPIILGSGSASEGLDLQGTKLVQILEPHFNNAKTDQVIGRGIRYKSHSHLPEDQRKVRVQRFISTLAPTSSLFGKTKSNTSVDQYLVSRALEKDRLIQQMKDALS
jgi:SNF2 family DNA or RNA helicase